MATQARPTPSQLGKEEARVATVAATAMEAKLVVEVVMAVRLVDPVILGAVEMEMTRTATIDVMADANLETDVSVPSSMIRASRTLTTATPPMAGASAHAADALRTKLVDFLKSKSFLLLLLMTLTFVLLNSNGPRKIQDLPRTRNLTKRLTNSP